MRIIIVSLLVEMGKKAMAVSTAAVFNIWHTAEQAHKRVLTTLMREKCERQGWWKFVS